MEKYFTPDISDIRVGYECEYYLGNSWHEHVVESLYTDRDGYGIFELEQYLQEGSLRVPYLTKEQIETEGWYRIDDEFPIQKFKHLKYVTVEVIYNYGNYHLFITIPGTIMYADPPIYYRGNIFSGECKDINTFRWICKLLKIN